MRLDLQGVLLVAAGSLAGALLRFGVYTWLPTRGFPWATLLVNLAGSFAVGALMLPGPVDHSLRLWLAVGFLASFTTLSTYSFETVELWRTGQRLWAVASATANAVGGPLMAFAGWRLRDGTA